MRIVINTFSFFKRLSEVPILGKLFCFNIGEIENISNPGERSEAIRKIYLANDVCKLSRPGRFADIDPIAVSLMSNHKKETIDIHDVAVSDGSTAVEFYRNIVKVYGKEGVRFTLSDKYSTLRVRKSFLTGVYDAEGKLVCGYVGPLSLGRRFKSTYPFGWLAPILFPDNPDDLDNCEVVRLFDGTAQEMLESGEVETIDYDVFEETITDRFTYVRVMNCLNFSYFSSEMLLAGIANLTSSLVDGGILQVGRTLEENNENKVIFYVKKTGRLRLLHEGNG